jgi:hypothetical protein
MNASPCHPVVPAAARRALAAALVLACGSAGAQEDAEEPAAVAVAARLELNAQPVAHMDFIARPATSVEATGWAAGPVHAVGVALGSRFDRSAALPGQAPHLESSLSVGLRWRSALSDRRRVDVAAWRRVAGASDSPARLGTRIELQFSSPRSSVALADFGAIGMQLEGNAKVQLKIRRGKPMFYYRSKF